MTITKRTMMTALLLLGGCARDPAAQEQPKDEPVASAKTAPAAGTKSIGIPECDEYFRQATLCFAHNAEKKSQMEGSIEPLRAQLLLDAADPERRARLPDQCARHTAELVKDCAK